MTPTPLMLTQSTLRDCRQRFTQAGMTGWATFCLAQERVLIKDNQLSPEIVHYARAAADRLREFERSKV